jgi:polyphenol oxidase
VAVSTSKHQLRILHSEKLSGIDWLVHGFSTRSGGTSRLSGGNSLNLGFVPHDSRKAVDENRRLFLRKLGFDHNRPVTKIREGKSADRQQALPFVSLRQIHSDLIRPIDRIPDEILAGDGMITDIPGLNLAVQTADCLPVILVDPKHHAIGVFHAGWRGTVQRIVEKGVGEMRRLFRSNPRHILAAIGPGALGCCYETGEEIRTAFESQFSYANQLFREVKESDPVREKYPLLFLTARAPGHGELPTKLFLDLAEANRRQLLEVGVPPKNIDVAGLCTICNPELFFSYRREKGKTGRMMAVVGIKKLIRKAGKSKTKNTIRRPKARRNKT